MSDKEFNLGYIMSNETTYKKLKNMELLATKNTASLTNEIWSIASIMSTIFDYSEYSDLIEFSTVCKKWSLLTAPIIHRSIKILRNQGSNRRFSEENLNTNEKIDAEVEECIANNSKYSQYVKELRFCESIKPKRAIEFLETFRYLTKLHISDVKISQGQFLCMIKPLDKLEELTFTTVIIKKNLKNRLYKESIKLPKTLTKLSLIEMKLNGNTELFNNTINSHSNLKQFILGHGDDSNFLTPFCKRYLSLKDFSYGSNNSKSHQTLTKIIESNPQITSLKLEPKSLTFLMEPIRKHLVNLQDFEFYSPLYIDSDFEYRFTKPIKMKKLKVASGFGSSILLNSLLQFSPELEEFDYTPLFGSIDRDLTLTVDKPTKIKKLTIRCEGLNEPTLDSILLNCPHLKVLDIIFPNEWRPYGDIVLKRCANLEHLTLYSRCDLHNQKEYNSLKFLSAAIFKNTLTSLTLNNLNFCCSANSLHLQNYSNLKFVKFQISNRGYGKWGSVAPFNKDFWSGYLKRCYLTTKYDGYKLIKMY